MLILHHIAFYDLSSGIHLLQHPKIRSSALVASLLNLIKHAQTLHALPYNHYISILLNLAELAYFIELSVPSLLPYLQNPVHCLYRKIQYFPQFDYPY